MNEPEHFVTLFDSNFLPQAIALAASLKRHFPYAELWVLCMDAEVQKSIELLGNSRIRTIRLTEIEDPRLISVKAGRSAREYCWTLTAFCFDAVFDRCPSRSVLRISTLTFSSFHRPSHYSMSSKRRGLRSL